MVTCGQFLEAIRFQARDETGVKSGAQTPIFGTSGLCHFLENFGLCRFFEIFGLCHFSDKKNLVVFSKIFPTRKTTKSKKQRLTLENP